MSKVFLKKCIEDRYNVDPDIIGKGTYGTVSSANNISNGNEVAIKSFYNDDLDEGIVGTTLREIACMIYCNCPSLIRALEVYIGNRCQNSLIMPLYECDLRQYINSNEVITVDTVSLFTSQLVNGLAYLESVNLIHRDIKPKNILVKGNQVVICDFGLGRIVNDMHMTQNIQTLWYRSPEILLGKRNYSSKVDIWSLGCVIVEMITKQALFPGDSEIDQLYKIFELLGTPNEKTWEGVSNLSEYKSFFPIWESKFDNFVENLDEKWKNMMNIVKKMLILYPNDRINVYELQDLEKNKFFLKKRKKNHILSLKYEKKMLKTKKNEIFSEKTNYLLKTKKNHLTICDLLGGHPDITFKMWNILLDWIIDVNLKFKLLDCTLHRCVQLLVGFLSKDKDLSRKKLQLLGITCLSIASKIEEIYPPEVYDYIYICDNAYTQMEFVEFEYIVLETLQFDVLRPTTFDFVKYYSKLCCLDQRAHALCKFLLEYTYFDNELLTQFNPSDIAACICLVACKHYNANPKSMLKLVSYTSRTLHNTSCFKQFAKLIEHSPETHLGKLTALYKKYSVRYFAVAKHYYAERTTT
jgi:serine/threonine protein kinase